MTALAWLAAALLAAPQEPVTLRWKADAPQAYKASLKSGAGKLEFDVAAVARQFSMKAPPDLGEKMREFLGDLKLPDEFGMTLLLVPAPEKLLSVKLVQNKTPLPAGDSPLEKLLKEMEGTVQLRGEVDDSGAVTSWWLQNNQKNLVALLCELPRNPVKPGDRWSLGVNLVQMGHGFVAEKAERSNLVRLAGVRKAEDGDVVASLEYLLSESVEGEFVRVPGQKGEPSTMAMNVAGKAEFSVTKGAWRSFVLRMTTKATGLTKSDLSQDLALERLPAVPAELLKLR